MNKTLKTLLVLPTVFLFAGCSFQEWESTDKEHYQINITGFKVHKDFRAKLESFNLEISEDQLLDYKSMYKEGFLDDSYYAYAEVQYNQKQYEDEYERLVTLHSTLEDGSTRYMIHLYDDLNVFIAVKEAKTVEYVRYFEDELKMRYLAMQGFTYDQTGIDEQLGDISLGEGFDSYNIYLTTSEEDLIII